MIIQLFLGSVIIALSIVIETLFIYLVIRFMRSRGSNNTNISSAFMMLYLVGTTLWMLLAFSIVTWVWALTLLILEAMPNLEQSLYFSMVAFTSLGFGDIVLEQDWRILSGLMAANGLVLFGLNTAVIVETLRGILSTMDTQKTEEN